MLRHTPYVGVHVLRSMCWVPCVGAKTHKKDTQEGTHDGKKVGNIQDLSIGQSTNQTYFQCVLRCFPVALSKKEIIFQKYWPCPCLTLFNQCPLVAAPQDQGLLPEQTTNSFCQVFTAYPFASKAFTLLALHRNPKEATPGVLSGMTAFFKAIASSYFYLVRFLTNIQVHMLAKIQAILHSLSGVSHEMGTHSFVTDMT